MKFSDKIAFMPLRYALPIVWLIIIVSTSGYSYFHQKAELKISVVNDITQHVRKKFTLINNNLFNAIDMGLSREQIFKTQHMFKSKKGKVMGYINNDAQIQILSGDKIDERIDTYLSIDFTDKNDFFIKPRQELCESENPEYILWANSDVFYMFRPVGEACKEGIHFLRYSVKSEREDHLKQMLQIIYFDTLLLLGLMVLMTFFSIYYLNGRLSRLLGLITGYRQDVKGTQAVIEGNDEFSMISKAFSSIAHRMTAVLNDMYAFVAVLDLRGNVLFVNNSPLQVSNLDISDVKGKKLSDAYWWEHDKDAKHEIESLIEGAISGDSFNKEVQIQIADENLIWVNFNIHPVYDAQGKIEYLLAEGIDISKQKQAFEEVLRQNRKAQMGEMLSMIAHQWRQPLGAISAISGKVMMDSELGTLEPEAVSEQMKKINRTVVHMSSTMHEFTSFFDPTKKAKSTNYKTLVDKCLDIMALSLERQEIKVNIYIEEKINIYSYEEELIQVIMDMLKNSADFFKQNEIENPKISILQFTKGEQICLSIEDNAGGIKDDDIHNIFDPYFSTKSDDTGTGLGLHMSKMIVEDHCYGRLKVEQIDGGTRFIICLPGDRCSLTP